MDLKEEPKFVTINELTNTFSFGLNLRYIKLHKNKFSCKLTSSALNKLTLVYIKFKRFYYYIFFEFSLPRISFKDHIAFHEFVEARPSLIITLLILASVKL